MATVPHGFGGVWSARVVALTALALTAVALTAVATGCGAANSAVGGESTLRPVETALAGTSYDVRYFTEFDDVRDLAMGDAYVYAATARGLLVFEMGVAAAPRRVLRADGLPSDDATALHVAGDGSVYVATRAGVARWRKQIVDVAPAPPVGLVLSLATDASGSLWACGALGAAKRMGDGWALLADSTGCRSLTAAPGGRFWINTDHALLSVHGDVVREHGADSGVPALPLGSVVALDAHRLLATLPTAPARGSAFAYFDGARWSTHVLRGGSSSGGALVPDAAGALLLSAAGAHRVTARALRGATKLERVGAPTRARVRGYRADFPGARDDVTTGAPLGAEGLVPAPTSSADPRLFTFDASVTAPRDTFLVRAGRGGVLVASRELGIAFLRQGEAATYFRAESAVPQQTLGFATDRGGDTFVLGRDGAVVRMHGESTQPVPSPNGRRIEAIATGPRGAYAVTVAGEGDTRVALFVWEQTSWTPVLERELDAGALSAISALVVEASGDAWVAIRVPSSAGDRPRGVVWLPASRDATVSFHANVEPVPGAESKPAPDDLARPVIGEPGFVWWSSLSGAVRIGAAQVVPFGEARGVPGEIVTDVAFAPPGRVWISAAEGVGYYEGQSMRFDAPAWVNAEKPTSLALDASGRLFAGTTKGVLVRVRDAWLRGGGILNGENVRDLAVDGDDRLWVATDHTLIRLTPRR